MTREDCILLGTIAKTHGVRGELIIRTANNSFDLKQDWESLFLQIEGILVPFFISTLRPFKSDEWVVKFDWYEDKTKADKLCGLPVWIQNDLMDPVEEEVFLDELIGYDFSDETSGKTGQISDFVDIPNNPNFEVEIDGKKNLVPARDEFIIEVNTKKKTILFELPEGLI
jgi:16S rRNA processing protein RimM